MMQGLQNKRVKVQLINLGNPNCAFNVQKAQQQKRLPNCQIFFVHETNQIWSNNRTCRAQGHWQVSGCPISSRSSHHLQIAVHLFHLRSNNATSWFLMVLWHETGTKLASNLINATVCHRIPKKKLYRLKYQKKILDIQITAFWGRAKSYSLRCDLENCRSQTAAFCILDAPNSLADCVASRSILQTQKTLEVLLGKSKASSPGFSCGWPLTPVGLAFLPTSPKCLHCSGFVRASISETKQDGMDPALMSKTTTRPSREVVATW